MAGVIRGVRMDRTAAANAFRVALAALGALAGLGALGGVAEAAAGPTGPNAVLGDYWTEDREAIARIFREDGAYHGRLVWTEDADAKDDENPDEALRDRALRGLVFVRGFRWNGDGRWVDGEVYAPDDGKTYSGRIAMDGPDTLELRGYVGIPLFGRTATWQRVARSDYPEGLEPPGS